MMLITKIKSLTALFLTLVLGLVGCAQQSVQPQPSSETKANLSELPSWQSATEVLAAEHEKKQSSAVIQSLFEQADEAFYLEDYELALSKLERAQRIEPRNAAVYYRLSVVRLKLNDLTQAEQLARKSLSLSYHVPAFQREVWLLIAASRAKMGDQFGEQDALNKAKSLPVN